MKTIPDDLAARLHENSGSFLELGDDARIDALAEQIGVARATLYYYFSGKDDVTSFFMQEKLANIGQAVRNAGDGVDDPLTRFAAGLAAILDEVCEEPAMCLHLTAAQTRPKALEAVVATMRHEVAAPLREALLEARAAGAAQVDDLDVTIDAILGALNRAVLHQYAANGTVDAARVRDGVLALVLDGLRPRSG